MKFAVVADRLRLLSIRDLVLHPVRNTVAVAIVTVCSALLVAVLSIYGSIIGSIDRVDQDISGDVSLQITANSSGGVPAKLVNQIRRLAGVAVAAPLVITTVPVNGAPTLLLGVDASMAGIDSRLGRTVLNQASGPDVFGSGGVIGGSRMSLRPGQSLDLGGHPTRVTMVLDDDVASEISSGRFIVAPLRLAQTIAGRPGAYDSVLVVTAEGASRAKVTDAIDRLTAGRVITSEPLLASAKNGALLAFLRDALLICTSLALIVAMFLIFNAFNMAIIRRRSTFATMRAIGAQPAEIVRCIVGEGIVV
ncbi:FtsX-like permease family protein, partial [Mycobacterium sp. 852002-40037_SCH5390672]|uniref:ABC transporter permease n=1 Tax=Mycobacterium sp. 852002-40037_SCH5390672 TaxID=1834089 RepID=UPI0012E83538